MNRTSAEDLRAVFDVMPNPLLIVDANVIILDCNLAAEQAFALPKDYIISRRAGEVLNCLKHLTSAGGCGTHEDCKKCVIRGSVGCAILGQKIARKYTRMQIRNAAGETVNADLLVSSVPLQNGKVLLSLEDTGELLALRDIMPICCSCRAVKLKNNQWQKVDAYLYDELRLRFSHGICPECRKVLYPDSASEMHEAPAHSIT
jgi:nitrogen-specific signal transduction histidine kinase